MNANNIVTAENIIESLNEEKQVKVVKKDRGLLERTVQNEKIILTEDNKQILLG